MAQKGLVHIKDVGAGARRGLVEGPSLSNSAVDSLVSYMLLAGLRGTAPAVDAQENGSRDDGDRALRRRIIRQADGRQSAVADHLEASKDHTATAVLRR